jgi:hypothetical protein
MTDMTDDGLVDGGVNTEEIRYELKSLPGAWVELRQMSYGDVLVRQDMVMDMKIQMADRKSRASTMELTPANVQTTAFDFQKCVVRHNIRNPKTKRAFQFSNPADWRGVLNPKAGKEIDKKIREINGFDNEEDEDFFEKPGNGSGPSQEESPQ